MTEDETCHLKTFVMYFVYSATYHSCTRVFITIGIYNTYADITTAEKQYHQRAISQDYSILVKINTPRPRVQK